MIRRSESDPGLSARHCEEPGGGGLPQEQDGQLKPVDSLLEEPLFEGKYQSHGLPPAPDLPSGRPEKSNPAASAIGRGWSNRLAQRVLTLWPMTPTAREPVSKSAQEEQESGLRADQTRVMK